MVLVVEPESAERRRVASALERSGYAVVEAADLPQTLDTLDSVNPDVVVLPTRILDLPDTQRLKILRQKSQAVLLVVSDRSGTTEIVAALESGADDYLTTPFALGELLARIRVTLRRRRGEEYIEGHPVDEDRLVVDPTSKSVMVRGREVHLTPTEFKLLWTLVRNEGQVVGHRDLLGKVWGAAYAEETHYLRVFVGQLRQKIELEPSQPRYIVTEPGRGYRATGQVDVAANVRHFTA
ncbi:MAG: response regulator transcription factor [Armatimonadetes bacterium]|nr:response regulator transcription factor [Armatimonadota bacterium]